MTSSGGNAHVLDLPRFANDFDIHRRAAYLAVLDGRVIALRRVGHGDDDLATMRTLDLDFDEHGKMVSFFEPD